MKAINIIFVLVFIVTLSTGATLYVSNNFSTLIEYYNYKNINYFEAVTVLTFLKNPEISLADNFSNQAKIHMNDVRYLINTLKSIHTIFVLLFISLITYYLKNNKILSLRKLVRTSSLALLSATFLIILFQKIDFYLLLYAFHETIFTNKLWLFGNDDKLVQIFPLEFFSFVLFKIITTIFISIAFILLTTEILFKNVRSSN